MTRLIDIRAPRYDVTESLVLHVDAGPAEVLDAVDRLGRDPHAGVQALGSRRRERLFGLAWHPKPGTRARVDIVWDVSVEPDEDGGSYLSSTRRFVAGDAIAREALLSQWRYVRPVADTVARRTLRAIKHAAEERPVRAARQLCSRQTATDSAVTAPVGPSLVCLTPTGCNRRHGRPPERPHPSPYRRRRTRPR